MIETINIGVSANDGTGDPLRTAFNKLNTNFLNITADGGDEINVTDPTTSTDATLNDALANIYALGSVTPDLQAVTDEGSTTTNPIVIKDGTDTVVEIFNDGGEGRIILYTPGGSVITYSSNSINFNNGVNQTTLYDDRITVNSVDYPLPTGVSSQIATLDDIPTLDATPTNGSTNGVESNGVFDALATKVTFWGSALDGTSVANTLTISPTYSQLIPANTFGAGDNVFLNFRATSPGAKTSASSIYFYVNTSNSLSGATQLGIYTGAATSRTLQADRMLSVKGSTTKTINPSASLSTDTGASAAMTAHTINWAVDQYIIFAIGHTANDQTMFGDFYSIEKK